MRKSYLAENKELAYRLWRASNQNVEQTLRELRKHPEGFPLSKPTLYTWMDEGAWKERATRADAEEQKANDATASAEGRALLSLESVQQHYEEYFKTLGKARVDNQAMFAYTGVIKSIFDIKMKASAHKATLFLEFMRDLVQFLSKHDPDSVGVIEKNFDEFASWAKEKYGV
jgi:hypothetical protein